MKTRTKGRAHEQPRDKENPWISLSDLLTRNHGVAAEKVATLATAIEKNGIYTWDRFGRMIKATKDDRSNPYSQMKALDLLALVYEGQNEAKEARQSGGGDQLQHELDSFIENYQGPLVRFGWPSKQCPDFTKYKLSSAMPDSVMKAGQPDEDGLLGTRERKSLYVMIRALMQIANISTNPLKPYPIAESLLITIDQSGEELSKNTIAEHLKRIYPQS